jgi:hypothetical protein
LANLRGVTFSPPPGQVAVAAVHERFGPFGARDVDVVAIDHRVPGFWDVEVSVREAATAVKKVHVTIASTRRASAQLTCRALSDTPATQYRVVDLRTH